MRVPVHSLEMKIWHLLFHSGLPSNTNSIIPFLSSDSCLGVNPHSSVHSRTAPSLIVSPASTFPPGPTKQLGYMHKFIKIFSNYHSIFLYPTLASSWQEVFVYLSRAEDNRELSFSWWPTTQTSPPSLFISWYSKKCNCLPPFWAGSSSPSKGRHY